MCAILLLRVMTFTWVQRLSLTITTQGWRKQFDFGMAVQFDFGMAVAPETEAYII